MPMRAPFVSIFSSIEALAKQTFITMFVYYRFIAACKNELWLLFVCWAILVVLAGSFDGFSGTYSQPEMLCNLRIIYWMWTIDSAPHKRFKRTFWRYVGCWMPQTVWWFVRKCTRTRTRTHSVHSYCSGAEWKHKNNVRPYMRWATSLCTHIHFNERAKIDNYLWFSRQY